MAALGGKAESREAKGEPAHRTWGLRQGWNNDHSGRGVEEVNDAWRCSAQCSGGSLGGSRHAQHSLYLVSEGEVVGEDPTGHNKRGQGRWPSQIQRPWVLP